MLTEGPLPNKAKRCPLTDTLKHRALPEGRDRSEQRGEGWNENREDRVGRIQKRREPRVRTEQTLL